MEIWRSRLSGSAQEPIIQLGLEREDPGAGGFLVNVVDGQAVASGPLDTGAYISADVLRDFLPRIQPFNLFHTISHPSKGKYYNKTFFVAILF
jgi:hypothetical protein